MSEYYNDRSGNGLGKEGRKDEILKCPKCNSENLWISGPFLKRYKNGRTVPQEPAKYHCWNCGYNW